jgi:hypothetical protein
VRFAVANSGYLPSNVSKRAIERKVARGTVFSIHLPPGVVLMSGRSAWKAGTWTATRPRTRLQAFLPNRESHRRPRGGRMDRARPRVAPPLR